MRTRSCGVALAFTAFALASCPARGPVRVEPPPMKPPEILPTDPTFVQVRGRVVDVAGKPIAGADVLVMGGGRTGARSTTNATGEFTASGLPVTSEGYVLVLAPGRAVAAREPVPITQRTAQSVTLRLEPERVLAGRVVGADGAPLAGVRVEIRGDRKLATHARKGVTWERAAQIDTLWTGADGTFRFAQLYAGEFDVTATDDAQHTAATHTTSGGEAVELRLVER